MWGLPPEGGSVWEFKVLVHIAPPPVDDTTDVEEESLVARKLCELASTVAFTAIQARNTIAIRIRSARALRLHHIHREKKTHLYWRVLHTHKPHRLKHREFVFLKRGPVDFVDAPKHSFVGAMANWRRRLVYWYG